VLQSQTTNGRGRRKTEKAEEHLDEDEYLVTQQISGIGEIKYFAVGNVT
jgi:hypothetical protein